MLLDLPKEIQSQVLHYLKLGNFVAAKQLHDVFLEQQLKQISNLPQPTADKESK